MAVNTLNSGGAKVGGHFVHAACVAAHVYLRVHVCLCVHARMLSGAGCGPCERRHVTRADYGTFRLAPRGDQSQLFFGADHLARLWLFLSCLARDSAGVVLFVSHASLSRTARCLAQLFVSLHIYICIYLYISIYIYIYLYILNIHTYIHTLTLRARAGP